jgi:hypothetical protein
VNETATVMGGGCTWGAAWTDPMASLADVLLRIGRPHAHRCSCSSPKRFRSGSGGLLAAPARRLAVRPRAGLDPTTTER